MAPSSRLCLIAVGFVCVPYGLFADGVYVTYFAHHAGEDWMVFYTAARAYLDGNLPLTYDGARFTAHMNAVFADWLPKPLSFHPWLYPPPFLLVLIPFGMLTFGVSFLLFQLVTFGCLVAAIWYSVGRGYRRWLHAVSLLLSPAAAFAVGSGQNAFLTTALFVGGFGLLPRRPAAAGALLGLATYKPQLWLMVPVALVAARAWRALAGAIAAATAMLLASIAVVGVEPWRVWVEWMTNAPADSYQAWLKWGRLNGESIYTNLALLGVPNAAANVGQVAAAGLAACCVWWCYRRSLSRDLQFVVLLGATVLAAPQVTNYDTVLLVVAATLLFAHALENGLQIAEIVVPVLVWMVQFFNPPGVFRIGFITPFLTCALIASAIARMRTGVAATGSSPIRPPVPGVAT